MIQLRIALGALIFLSGIGMSNGLIRLAEFGGFNGYSARLILLSITGVAINRFVVWVLIKRGLW